MKTYTVHYRHESGASLTGLADDTILVKQGFSWPAFLVPFLWLVYKRMWIVLLVYVGLELALAGILGFAGLPDALSVICSFAISAIIGFEGNELYRSSLARRRYHQHAVIAADNLLEAEHRFFSGMEQQFYGHSGALNLQAAGA